MLEAFKSHLQSRKILQPTAKYLLACSGGMDSMCLGQLLIQAEIPFEVAHVNFQLRGPESEADQTFVQNWAKSFNLPFHLKLADTEAYAAERSISIQMAAREIRYAFFEQVRASQKLDGIVLAHHEDDQVETIFLNLLRGTGIEGIYGMADRKGWLIRPLLPFSKAELEGFMIENQLPWRVDKSNEKADYKRNNLRLNGLPAIYNLEPDAKQNLLTSFSRLKDTGRAYNGLFEQWRKSNVQEDLPFQLLPFSAILNQPGSATLLYFWLRPFGFNSDQAQAISDTLARPKTGLTFQSASHLIHFDREKLILSPIPVSFDSVFVDAETQQVVIPEGNYEVVQAEYQGSVDKSPINAQFDLSRLDFPLEIRTWQEGDRFIPIGMNSAKKVSDFLIDIKYPLAKKQGVKVLTSGGKIAWIVGLRIADWAKCNSSTQKILHFKRTEP